jgi:tight adherence protein B
LLPLAVAFAAAVLAAGASGAGGVTLTEAKGSDFPNRSFVISLPTTRVLIADDLTVTENGKSVADVSVLSPSQVGERAFGVVLVVDASESMDGRPIQAAMDAARGFASRRNPKQQLAVVTFNSEPTVTLPFTTSVDKIEAALAQTPQVAYGTHIYDAVAKAEDLLAKANIQSGSILVLSDGADTGSLAKSADVAAAARDAHIKLYAIGLRSEHFDPKSLTSLADAGGGDYTLASQKDLRSLFDNLGGRLSQQYVLRYKSLAGPKVPVQVKVDVSGAGNATAAYETPPLPIKTVAPYHKSIASRIWTSPILMVLLSLLVAGTAALLVILFLEPKSSQLPGRMAEFVSVPGLQAHDRRTGTLGAVESEQAARSRNLLARLDLVLEIAGIKTSAVTVVSGAIIATVLTWLFIYAATGSFWWALFAILVPIGVREWVVRSLARRRDQFAEQLPDALQVISSALRSGHSFASSLAVVVESGSDPMKSEMQRVVADEQLGVPLEIAVAAVSKRMASRDLEQVGLVAELQREAGGNAAEVVDRVAETIRERFELRRLVKTLTVQGRMSRWIVSALPVAIILILQVVNPHYLHPLVAHTGGRVILGFAAALCVAGSLVIKKIVDIKV